MMRRCAICFVFFSLAALSLTSTPTRLYAQGSRGDLIAEAMNQFESADVLEMLVTALNPNIPEPLDSVWDSGIMNLADVALLDLGDEDFAAAWLRWGLRLRPMLTADPDVFAEETIAALMAAREFVGQETVEDPNVNTEWIWDASPAEGRGELRLPANIGPTGIRVTASPFRGVDRTERVAGTLGQDETLSLRPGSYILRANAEGFVAAEVTRELLPGIATVVSFNLVREVVAEETANRGAVLPSDAEVVVRRQLGQMLVSRFGTEQTCGAGVFVGSDGLFLTTYRSIRGADGIEVQLSNGQRIGENVFVAAYDTDLDVAVLKLPSSPGDSLAVAPVSAQNQYAWAFGFPGCRSPAITRLRITSWQNQPEGLLRLSDSLAFGDQGGPLIDQGGLVVGLATGGASAVPVDHALSSLEEARRNVRIQQLLSLAEVARRERHTYGSVSIGSGIEGSVVRITPLERWHWQEAAGRGSVPLTFAGPMGRYRLDLQTPGEPPHQTEFEIDPGVLKQIGEPQIVARGGGFPWPIALLGAAGAAVAGVLVLGGGDDVPPPTIVDDRTRITVIVPHIR